ncbi:O-acyltransferase WSD1-like [Dioscorea cayenensis subsp. rotundata]|uniref:O-acyltransferase WSD1-like n=1 Tax=Dioscorea cayennensis subsp. rotundata TaxID=55577 RepID=A0AB40AKS8_DIOCR|nr:O-acyltransferase WSD1-like [Dioscorea cayenensis subsp. rotundata]
MVSNELKKFNMEEDEPVSPTGQYFNSSVLSVSILAFFESDKPIDDSPAIITLENSFLPVNPRFSSIMVKDEHGVQTWKRVNVNLEEHLKIPTFPAGLESYDEYVQEYIAKIAMEPLSQRRPLWELHLIKYPTKHAEGVMVFKLHHALGDGFSLMGALFSMVQRADKPSLPLTFPSSHAKPQNDDDHGSTIWETLCSAFSVGVNTICDFGWSFLKSTLIEDDKTPIRSGDPGVEFRPITISTVTFSLNDVRRIKAKLGGTVNDVMSGIIFYGTQLYLHTASKGSSKYSKVTALVLLNTRVISNYQNLQEMTKPDAKSPWGNQFGFIHVSVPSSTEDLEKGNPLDFVMKARETINAKRNSLGVFLTGRLLEMLRKMRGPEVTAQYVHSTLKNTSMTVSNLIGPIEQMQIAGQNCRGLYFMVVGVPQSLTITMVSYNGKIKVAMGTEKGFIDSELLVSCMEKSFQRIFTVSGAKTC